MKELVPDKKLNKKIYDIISDNNKFDAANKIAELFEIITEFIPNNVIKIDSKEDLLIFKTPHRLSELSFVRLKEDLIKQTGTENIIIFEDGLELSQIIKKK